MATDNGYTTVLKFFKSLNLVKTVPDKDSTSNEEVGTGDNSTTDFWLDNIGVIEDTYTLYYGSSMTTLVETTDYTIDLDNSKITLTAGGVSKVGTEKIYASYSYNQAQLLNSYVLRILNFAENYVKRKTEMTFVDASADSPTYKQITNETFEGRFDARWKTFDTFYNPLIDVSTTVSADYITGSTSLVLSDATGFPETGTIAVGTNKVAYTAKSADTITVPSTTPSVSADTVVIGECIEISKESEGTTPSYTVLERDKDYKIDFLQGRIELLGNAYFGEFQDSDRFYPANYMIRANYLHGWYEEGSSATIPDDIEQCTIMVATNRLMKSTVGKAHIEGLNSFNPSLVAVDRTDIDEIIEYYKQLNVGTSPFNKQNIS